VCGIRTCGVAAFLQLFYSFSTAFLQLFYSFYTAFLQLFYSFYTAFLQLINAGVRAQADSGCIASIV
jgi:hypothetical protein